MKFIHTLSQHFFNAYAIDYFYIYKTPINTAGDNDFVECYNVVIGCRDREFLVSQFDTNEEAMKHLQELFVYINNGSCYPKII